MRAGAAVVAGLALAGCSAPYYYAPAPTPIVIAPPPLITPYTTARPSYEPPAYASPGSTPPGYTPPGDTAPSEFSEPPPSDPSTYESPPVLLQPMPDTVETPPAAAPEPQRPAAAAVEPPPADTGSAVPMMGFRPMKGQKAPTP